MIRSIVNDKCMRSVQTVDHACHPFHVGLFMIDKKYNGIINVIVVIFSIDIETKYIRFIFFKVNNSVFFLWEKNRKLCTCQFPII